MKRLATTFIAASVVGLTACGLCSDEVVASATSKDGTRRAWMNVQNCGATTGYADSLMVEVRENSSSTEALFGELGIGRSDEVQLRWENDDLVVTCVSDCRADRILTRAEKVGRSRILLEGFDVPKKTP